MTAVRRFWRSPYVIAIGFAILAVAVGYLVTDSAGAEACRIRSESVAILCDGPPPTWAFVVTFWYALGLSYITLRRWINRPTDDDPAD
jgi:hypothetical protein